jgi:hypothetical protein
MSEAQKPLPTIQPSASDWATAIAIAARVVLDDDRITKEIIDKLKATNPVVSVADGRLAQADLIGQMAARMVSPHPK